MAKINFKGQAQRARKLKRAPSKYKESAGRPNISMSPGVAPAYPAVPYKYLPVSFQDENTQDWVVMPKGKIASMVLSTNDAWDASVADNSATSGALETGQMGEGFKSDGVTAWGAITAPMDGYYGVSQNIKGMLVPCNGGNDVTYSYDHGFGDSNSIGKVPSTTTSGAMVAAGEDLVINANAPIGVMEHDVYQDIRGANLNYDMRNKNWGVLAQQFIKIPCVDLGAWNAYSGLASAAGHFVPDASATVQVLAGTSNIAACGGAAGSGCTDLDVSSVAPGAPADADGDDTFVITKAYDANGDEFAINASAGSNLISFASGLVADSENITLEWTYTDPDAGSDAPNSAIDTANMTSGYEGYKAVSSQFGFLTFNSDKVGHGLAGGLLKSDCFGNWMHEVNNPQSTSRTAQTCGRLLGVDYRFNKDLLDTVQSRYEDDAQYRVAGTGTYGVPQYLYNFAYLAMNAAGFQWSQDEASMVKGACDAGVFGEAWIQLNCQ